MIRSESNIDFRGDRRRIDQAIYAELTAIGLDMERTAVQYLDSRNINVDGDIRDSIRSEVKKAIDSFLLSLGANAPHAIFVHEGTKPHWPPAKPIRVWVHKKLNVPAEEIDTVTYLVQRKIAREGTKAKPFLGVAFRAHVNKVGGRIGRAIERGI